MKIDWARINAVAFTVNFLVVALSRLSLIGKNNRAVSNAHPTMVTPSGWAMRIWPVIFGAEVIFTLLQLRADKRRAEAVSPWFAIACIFQAAWSVAFARELLTLSAVLLPMIALCLTIAVCRLAPLKARGDVTVLSAEYWVLHFPIGLHAGWTTAASLVMINIALEAQSLKTKEAVLMVTIVVAPLAAGLVALVLGDLAYLFAIAWALAAIADKQDVRRATLPPGVAAGVDQALSALVAIVVVFGALVVVNSRVRKERFKRTEGGKGGDGKEAKTAPTKPTKSE